MTTREQVETYLENYGKTESTEIDNILGLFKTDVATIAKDIEKGDAYVYSKEEWIEFINEQDEDFKEYLLNDLPLKDYDVVIDNVGGGTYYI